MKRIILVTVIPIIVIIVGFVLIIYDLLQPTLTCTINTSNYNSVLKLDYKKDKLISYDFKDEMIFAKDDNINSELYYHSKYDYYSMLIAEKHAKVVELNDYITKVSVSYNFEKDKSNYENLLLVNRNDSVKEVKSKLKELNYVCK